MRQCRIAALHRVEYCCRSCDIVVCAFCMLVMGVIALIAYNLVKEAEDDDEPSPRNLSRLL